MSAPAHASALPPGAHAIIEAVPAAGRRPRRTAWRLRFEQRTPSVADPLGQVELRFPDRQTAERYCRRQGLRFTCLDQGEGGFRLAGRLPPERPPVLCCWPTGPHARCCGRYPAEQARPGRQPEFSLAG